MGRELGDGGAQGLLPAVRADDGGRLTSHDGGGAVFNGLARGEPGLAISIDSSGLVASMSSTPRDTPISYHSVPETAGSRPLVAQGYYADLS